MGIILLALPSCKSLDPTIAASATSTASATTHFHDTLIIRDSIFVRERVAGDTIFRDRIEYRDRWRIRMVHDTIVRTDSIVQIIEHPPKRYVPPFYKRCTIALWAIIAVATIVVIGRFAIGRRKRL